MCLSFVKQGWNHIGRQLWSTHWRLVCVQEEGFAELTEGEGGRGGS